MYHTSLTIKWNWLSFIKNGKKKEEYRAYKKFYHQRFLKFIGTGEEIKVTLINGYKKDSPRITVICTVEYGYGKSVWGAPLDEKVYILKIKGIIEEEK